MDVNICCKRTPPTIPKTLLSAQAVTAVPDTVLEGVAKMGDGLGKVRVAGWFIGVRAAQFSLLCFAKHLPGLFGRLLSGQG